MAEFTYKLPFSEQTLLKGIATKLEQEGHPAWAAIISECKLSISEGGYSYYEGRSGKTRWNATGISIKIQAGERLYKELKDIPEKNIIIVCQALIPDEVGFDVKKVEFIPLLQDDLESPDVNLPKKPEETLQILLKDINESLSRGEPTLVLDRLHTFASKLLSQLCAKHLISTVNEKGEKYPLHSLAGMLVKYYEKNRTVQSDFSLTALKCSISLFEKFNEVRNLQSFAHDNIILNEIEASFAVRTMANVITFLDSFDNQYEPPSFIF